MRIRTLVFALLLAFALSLIGWGIWSALYAQSKTDATMASALTSASNGALRAQGAPYGVGSSIAARTRLDPSSKPGSVGKTWAQVSMTKAELEANPKFWLLGYSERDVGWLTKNGYPGLVEEEQLSKLSIEGLRALADAGDLNATAHLGVRLAQQALTSSDLNTFRQARYFMSRGLVEGGPYQAAKTAEFFVNLAKDKSLATLGSEQKERLIEDLLPYYELARGLSSAYGDFAAIRMFNVYRDIGLQLGLPPSPGISFDTAMGRIANINHTRASGGLPPYSFERRPSPPGPPEILVFQANNIVFSR